ncbi:hypothetical protein NLU14_06470 [Marinobacter sp. 71-i]|uniref:DUF4148 domain-containing protein n=1 Tax=Marinobacter iranensis TaxID=2962607 RepID=A0ABT5Y873_9GAMM|nr:hypothetical protein [Marinobacter iranensis]MDF0749871.1 hypothetical protein [Marinobacter iranensis]
MTSGIWRKIVVGGCLGLLLAAPSLGVANDDLDVTMRMVTDDDDLTESVVREIKLREPVALGRRGDKAGEQPSDKAYKAQGSAREAARSAAERAREVRERNKHRGRPEVPGKPAKAERPEPPGLD